MLFYFLTLRLLPRSTLFPYTTLFRSGIPSHVAPETPGSIHEGGELGYALSHAYGAAFDNPDLIVACVVGDNQVRVVERSEEHTSELQSRPHLVCRLLLEKKKNKT